MASTMRNRVFVQAVIILGVGLLVYPSAANWFSSLHHNSELSGYVQAVERTAPEVREDLIAVAQEYNSRMPQGPLRDPFSDAGGAEEEDAAYAAYEHMLEASPSGVMGRLNYSKAGVDLPIFHGTGDKTLATGVGHLYGSSLPIGGPGTHSVLTSHSGLVNATLFSLVPKRAAVSDEFTMTVLGEKHYYRVDHIEEVLPHESESLQIVEGEDYVTLLTCTPIGVNTHRLLVRGTAIPAPVDVNHEKTVGGDGIAPSFPWWAVWMGSGILLSFAVFFRKKKKPGPDDPQSNAPEHKLVDA